jgi:Zn-dependent protease with chaperone function/tetratricopeptide (TPR) repeat protein
MVIVFLLLSTTPCLGQEQPKTPKDYPSAEAVAEMLNQEPMTMQNWPTWRTRLWDWLDDRSDATTPAFIEAWNFMMQQVNANDELPPPLSKDAFAWYLLGSAYLQQASAEEPATPAHWAQAEKAMRQSLALNPNSARAHARLALILLRQRDPRASDQTKMDEAARQLVEARGLEPSLPLLPVIEGELALDRGRFDEAQKHFREALRLYPHRPDLALALGWAIVANKVDAGRRGPQLEALVDQFPDNGPLVCLYAISLAEDDRVAAAAKQLRRARALGADPNKILSPKVVSEIESAAAPWLLLQTFGWTMFYFTAIYGVLMLLMAGVGVLLARRTRGNRALHLLGAQPEELITHGMVARTSEESSLAKLYAMALVVGLILFYVAIPFLVAGLLVATGLALYGIFLLPRIPIKLVIVVVVIGLGMVWAVLKSLFTRSKPGSFGVAKTATDCPRLFQTVSEVAQRVDTPPVDEIYLAPGSSIGVHQEGRGPFGSFGVKRRVLTLGMSTMHFLTVNELQSILAHEYAHFSHRDTYYNRFIYQVTLSITQALNGIGASGGKLNYVNPFFWFLYLYYKAFTLLSAGFSRSREFLADRMAASLYGADVFASALTKVCTDGTLFEMTIYQNISRLLEENQSFVNMYAAFRSYRDEQLSAQEREDLNQKLLEEKESIFATHPTYRERIEAVAPLPKAPQIDSASALQLFENPAAIEEEMTQFLTGYMYHMQRLQAQAAAQ